MDPSSLPIEPALGPLLEGLRAQGRVVLKAPPGAGKTTRVPEAILDTGPPGQILLLEPRRVAARAAARHLAERRGERVGGTIGLQVRFEKQRSARTRLLVVTEGILTRRMIADPLLEDVSCVILDEFHERSVHTDLALGFLRQTLEVRDDLSVVVMSATLDPGPVADFLAPCARVQTEGRAYPVDVRYADAGDRRPARGGGYVERLEDKVASAVRAALRETDEGHVLAFLPGAPEIRRTAERLAGCGAEVLPLHGSLSTREQDRVFTRAAGRRAILATNIAETSVTIEGVKTVVDSGLEKSVRHDAKRAVDVLDTVRISRFSAEQRAGRAGRTGPGRAWRLWSRAEDAQLVEEATPEIARVDPVPVLLMILAFAPGDPRDLALLTPLPDRLLDQGMALLRMLGLVDERGRLTEGGKRAVDLPVHPREAVLLTRAAEAGLLEEGALAAAVLSEQDVLTRPHDIVTDSDLGHRLELLFDAEAAGGGRDALRRCELDPARTRRVYQARDQLLRIARRAGLDEGTPPAEPHTVEHGLTRALLAAYPDRLCARREASPDRAKMASGGGVRLHASSGVREGKLFLALDVGGASDGKGELSVRMAAGVSRADVEAAAGAAVRTEEVASLDADGRVRGRRVSRVGDLILEQKEGIDVGPGAIEAALLDAARSDPARFLSLDDDAQRLVDRIRFAARALPEKEWPDVSEAGLLALLPELVVGKRTLGELKAIDWKNELLGRLGWEKSQLLDREAPERWTVPSGSQVKLDYRGAAEGGPVVLAVRMQEMFGATETPTVAGQKVLLHLLAPNRRPAQVTDDLGGFWERTWAEVKKELRRRYPKHSWPDDPATAEPERRPRRKR